MVDYLKNSNNLFDKEENKELKKRLAKKKPVFDQEGTQEQQKEESLADKKVNLGRYKDKDGLTLRKLSFGLWYATNKNVLVGLRDASVLIFIILTWGWFFFVYGQYTLQGMTEDRLISNELFEQRLPNHSFFTAREAEDIQVGQVQIVKLLDDKYDVFAQAKNPNEKLWGEMEFTFLIDNRELETEKTFILPGETKYLMLLAQDIKGKPVNSSVQIKNLDWSRLNPHQVPNWTAFRDEHLDIKISDIEFTPANKSILTENLNLNDLKFNAFNASAYNFWGVNFIIKMYSNNRVVGVNKYFLSDFETGQNRSIGFTIPGLIGNISNIEIIPEINILDKEVYSRFNYVDKEFR